MTQNTTKHTPGIDPNTDQISRKEALSKLGKYAGLIALGTFTVLNPQKAQAASPNPYGDQGGYDFGSRNSSSRESNRTRD